ncbi:HNH endonuclease [Mycobacterium phage GodPhather]|uniref:HNH endonuclease n=2 Tax=Northamptonvirus TaxID=3044777 RepID=A0A1J0MDN4_9CAUD|nr:HNH endonuclease [Mycobacterium phage Jeon]YP_010665421.1 HNH endonuclease [Mycobacterium phage Taptic]AVO21362.1 HNH endonuclease [Mycobacterium phage Megabear]QBP31170.1 HNH endonuclease [Mycobacterium phage Argie]QBP32626.1 HNH endonuclease [Mycobacterium phage GodPhather]QBP32716.1 HNH endonuclease [Mycobacterium phage Cepens]WRQ08202.1 HNH endonuclease [Mycobacterium phage harman]BBC28576.1 putative HNH endonuclease [Mycobacterium phage D12]BBC28666.1 putative HNH endonuclease [Myco
MKDGEFSPEVKAIADGRSMGRCEVCVDGFVHEYHHRRPRGAGGARRWDTGLVSNCLAVCHNCHRLIESNRALARTMGWLVPQSQSPTSTPVIVGGRRVFLTEDGFVVEATDAA